MMPPHLSRCLGYLMTILDVATVIIALETASRHTLLTRQ